MDEGGLFQHKDHDSMCQHISTLFDLNYNGNDSITDEKI